MDQPTTRHQSAPMVGWAVAGPIRPRWFPNLRWGRAIFIAAECLLNAVLLTYLVAALAGFDIHARTQDIVLTLVLCSGLASNIALLIIVGTVRYLRRRSAGGLAA